LRKILDIKPEERIKVSNLFFQNFFDGLGTAFFYAMGIFIFLGHGSHHEALHYYPLVFFIGGFLILIVSPFYIKVEARARTDYLIFGLAFLVILLVALAFILLKMEVTVFTGITLLILYHLVYYLRQTQFWGLSSLSFNVLQSRRLFSIVSAGDLPAKFFGYTLVFQLLERGVIQPENLIYFAVIAYSISLIFLRRIFKSDHHLKHSSHQHFRSGVKSIKFFGNNLIRSMAIMAFLIMVVVFIVDYTFTKVVMHKINDEDVDMYLLVSTVLYVSYGLASVLKLFFTGRMFQILGIRWTMILTPVLMLILILANLIITTGSSDPNWYYVRMFIFLYIGFLVFRDVIGKPIFLTLFQPLSKKMRLHGHNIVKGFAEPMGMVVSGGLVLIYYGYFEEYRLSLFAFAIIIPLLLWLYSAINVKSKYNNMLQNVINLRLLSGNRFILVDEKTNENLVEKLGSSDEIEVLFALDHLKNYNISVEKLIPLFKHKSETIRKAAWEVTLRITSTKEFGELIVNYLEADTSSHLKRHVHYLLAQKAESADDFVEFITDDHPELTEHILLGWSMHKRFELPEKTKEVVKNYLESSVAEKYNTGLRLQKILPSEVGKSYITKSLESLNFKQRKSAIIGSFGFLNPQFFRRIVSLMNNPQMSRFIKDELILLGDKGIDYLVPLITDNDDMNSRRLIQVLGQIGSDLAITKLVDLLKFRNPDLRKLIFDTLNSFEASKIKPYKNNLIHEYHKEIGLGIRIFSISNYLKKENTFLIEELNDLIRRIFRILSLLQDSVIIRRIEEGFFSNNSDFKANSIETLHETLKPELYKPFKPLVEELIDEDTNLNGKDTINDLLSDHSLLNKWTVCCLLSQFGCENQVVLDSLKKRNTAIINEQIKINNMENTNVLRMMEKVIMLRKTNLFSNTPENVLVEVAGLLKEERYEKGTVIFNKGDIGDCMYIIYSGKVKIHDGQSVFAIFEESNFFGDLAMLDAEPRSATATAETEIVLLRLDQEAIYELMNDRIEVAQGIIRTLCTRIRNLNKKYVEIESK